MAVLTDPRKLDVVKATWDPATKSLGAWKSAGVMPTSFLLMFVCMARAAVRSTLTPTETRLEVLSALYRYTRHFESGTPWLLTTPHLSNYYKDAQKTALSGRLGDAMGLNVAMHQGYRWFLHFEDAGWRLPRTGSALSKQPDYLLFSDTEAAMLECKGSLAQTPSRMKRTVRDGLKAQVLPYHLDPSPPYHLTKWMAVGTMVQLRDNLIALASIDRPATLPPAGVPVRPSQAIPLHYARWLKIMALHRAALQVAAGEGGVEVPELPVGVVQGHDFVFTSLGGADAVLEGEEPRVEFGMDRDLLDMLLSGRPEGEVAGLVSQRYPVDATGPFQTDTRQGVVLNDGTAVRISLDSR